MPDPINACPCCSGSEYAHCCKPFHEGALPKNALQLMRSRYSAYALGLADYLIATTHPANPHFSKNKLSWRQSILKFSQNSTFHKLEILDFKEKNTFATVTFTAYISQGGANVTFTEKSYFEKIDDRWFYRDGEVIQGHPKK